MGWFNHPTTRGYFTYTYTYKLGMILQVTAPWFCLEFRPFGVDLEGDAYRDPWDDCIFTYMKTENPAI